MITTTELHDLVDGVVESTLGQHVHGHTRRSLADDLAAALEDALPDDLLHDDDPDPDEPDAASGDDTIEDVA